MLHHANKISIAIPSKNILLTGWRLSNTCNVKEIVRQGVTLPKASICFKVIGEIFINLQRGFSVRQHHLLELYEFHRDP